MLTLAIDAASRRGGLALALDGRILVSQALEPAEGFAAALYPAAVDLLARANRRLAEVDLFAASAGPGSFTGVRVGLTAGKALAEACGKPLAAVSNLEALAYGGQGRLRAPVLDARRGQVYAALYEFPEPVAEGELVTRVEPIVFAWEQLQPRLQSAAGGREVNFVSTDAGVFRADGAAPLGLPAAAVTVEVLAEPLALLAEARFAAGGDFRPELAEAAYVRKPDVREPK